MVGYVRLYRSGYAVYAGDSDGTVVWFPECCNFTYGSVVDPSEDYPLELREVDAGKIGNEPWMFAVMAAGGQQEEQRILHRKCDRRGTKTEIRGDRDEEGMEKAVGFEWTRPCRFENPEMAAIRKETVEEQLSKLTDKQREIFVLYHKYGYTQEEIASMMKITQQGVNKHLSLANVKIGGIKNII